jgi:hypothetical protein
MGTEETNLPKLAAPARRALQGAGYTRLEDLTKVTESDVMRLHGMGPNAMQVLRNALILQPEFVTWLVRGRAGERSRAATVDDPVLCTQPKIGRWPLATA